MEGLFTQLKINKGDASGFAASYCKIAENCGYTATFPVPFMRPKIVIDILETGISDHDISFAVQTLSNALTIGFLPYKIHETNPSNDFEFCVESIAGEALSKYLSFQTNSGIKYERQMYLSDLIHVNGVASDSSHSDGIVYSAIGSNKIGTGVNELKDTAFAPLEQQGQLYATASNLLLGQFKFGLSSEMCCVAVMSTNGQLYQFGFVTLLYPSFPVLHLTSHVIDSMDTEGLKTAGAHLHRFRQFCRSQDEQLRGCRNIDSGEIYVALDDSRFFQKPISDVFKRCGSLLQSVLSVFKIYQRLYEHQIDVAVLPVAIRSGKLDQKQYMKHDRLVFPLLSDEFHMGVPLENGDFMQYLTALIGAYKQMHKAGVVHLDGYPSNIMWTKTNEQIVIRFVDFDVASFVDCEFDTGIRDHLRSGEFHSSHYYWHETEKASVKHDAWFVYIYSQMSDTERRESWEAGCRQRVDGIVTNYWKVVNRVRYNQPNIVVDFNEWFDAKWNL